MKTIDLIRNIFGIPLWFSFFAACGPLACRGAEPQSFKTLLETAGQNYRTPEGRAYYEKFLNPVVEAMVRAEYVWGESMPPSKKTVDFLFVIAADGTVKRLFYQREIPLGECLGGQLKTIKSLPPPPRDNWVVVVHASTTP